MKIIVPSDALLLDKDKCHDLIVNYFTGKSVVIAKGTNEAEIHLSWPIDKEKYIDPNLSEGLDWWKPETYIEDIPIEWKQCNRYQLSLNDSWTLYAWSKWLKKQKDNNCIPHEIVILHVDDHRDCMEPLLFHKINQDYIDPLTTNLVSIDEPILIESAIKSGAIAIGSFMPLFLHYFDRVQLRHLLPHHRMKTIPSQGNIRKVFVNDSLLCPDCLRPGLEFEYREETGIYYNPTDNISTFVQNIPNGIPVLLHVDMDYFNNRFDGDSDWEGYNHRHDPEAQKVYAAISNVFTTILKSVKLDDITIGLSPGFFPAEFWQKSIKVIDTLFD